MLSRKDTCSVGGYIIRKWRKKEYSGDGWTGCDREDIKDLKEKYFTDEFLDESSDCIYVEEQGIISLK